MEKTTDATTTTDPLIERECNERFQPKISTKETLLLIKTLRTPQTLLFGYKILILNWIQKE